MNLPQSLLHEPIFAGVDTRVAEGVALLREHSIGALFVVNEERYPLGVVTDRDMALRCFRDELDPEETKLSEIMGEEVWALDESTDLLRATAFLRRHRVRRLPIVNADKKLVAVLSADDLLRHVAAELRWASEAADTGLARERQGSSAGAQPSSFYGKE